MAITRFFFFLNIFETVTCWKKWHWIGLKIGNAAVKPETFYILCIDSSFMNNSKLLINDNERKILPFNDGKFSF